MQRTLILYCRFLEFKQSTAENIRALTDTYEFYVMCTVIALSKP